jgi:hypothetical protein
VQQPGFGGRKVQLQNGTALLTGRDEMGELVCFVTRRKNLLLLSAGGQAMALLVAGRTSPLVAC